MFRKYFSLIIFIYATVIAISSFSHESPVDALADLADENLKWSPWLKEFIVYKDGEFYDLKNFDLSSLDNSSSESKINSKRIDIGAISSDRLVEFVCKVKKIDILIYVGQQSAKDIFEQMVVTLTSRSSVVHPNTYVQVPDGPGDSCFVTKPSTEQALGVGKVYFISRNVMVSIRSNTLKESLLPTAHAIFDVLKTCPLIDYTKEREAMPDLSIDEMRMIEKDRQWVITFSHPELPEHQKPAIVAPATFPQKGRQDGKIYISRVASEPAKRLLKTEKPNLTPRIWVGILDTKTLVSKGRYIDLPNEAASTAQDKAATKDEP